MKSLRKTAKIFAVSHVTIFRWLKAAATSFRKVNQHNKKTETPLFQTIVRLVKEMVSSNPFQSCRVLQSNLQTILEQKISRSLCYTALKHANLTYKKAQIHTIAKQRKERIKQFQKEIKNVDQSKLVFVDETSVRKCCYPLYGYSKKGSRMIYRGKRNDASISMIVAINDKGVCCFKEQVNAFNSSTVSSFFENANFERGSTIVMDNASIQEKHRILLLSMTTKCLEETQQDQLLPFNQTLFKLHEQVIYQVHLL